MKRLTLIRHAKSNWNDPDLTDFERPLNGRGRRDAPVMALRLAEAVGAPDLWVSSPALRAITTARLFAEALSVPDTHVLLSPDIYDADLARLRARCCRRYPSRHTMSGCWVTTRGSVIWPTGLTALRQVTCRPARPWLSTCRPTRGQRCGPAADACWHTSIPSKRRTKAC